MAQIQRVATFAHAGNPTTAPTGTLPITTTDDIVVVFISNGGANSVPTISGTSITVGGLTWVKKESKAGPVFGGGSASDFNGSLWWTRASGNHNGQTVSAATTNSGSLAGAVYRGCVGVGDPFRFASAMINDVYPEYVFWEYVIAGLGAEPAIGIGDRFLLGFCGDDNPPAPEASFVFFDAGLDNAEPELAEYALSEGGEDTASALWDLELGVPHSIASAEAQPLTPTGQVAIVAALIASVSYKSEVLADSPISYWRLGEKEGTTAADVQGANAGTYKNSPILGVAGALASDTDTAMKCEAGSKHHVAVADSASLDYGDNMTYEAFAKRASINAGHTLIDKGSGAAIMRITTANRLLFRRNSVATIVESTNKIEDELWHHYVATKNGATVKLYIDAVDVTGTVTNSTLANNAIALGIGIADAGTNEPFNGSLDEVAVYGTALSAARVLAHYEAAKQVAGKLLCVI